MDESKGHGVWPQQYRPTTLGLMLPDRERHVFGATPHFRDILEIGGIAREIGMTGLWVADHFAMSSDESGPRGFWDVWTTMAALAAAIPDVTIGPMVACTAYRHPGVIVKMTEMIQDISGGRFILGIGAGWHKPEYDQFGIRFEPRVSQFEEAIQIIHGLLRDGEIDFPGKYYQANHAVNLPRAASGPTTPILVGSTGDRMLESLVTYADAWNGGGPDDATILAKMAKVDAACHAVGRDPKSVIRTTGVTVSASSAKSDKPGVISGSDDEKISALRHLADLGIEHAYVRVEPSTPETIAALTPVVAGVYAN